MGTGRANLSSAISDTQSSGPKVPFTTSKLVQRWAGEGSVAVVLVCYKKKLLKLKTMHSMYFDLIKIFKIPTSSSSSNSYSRTPTPP